MERYTDEERLVIVTAYMDCGQNIAATLRKITDHFALHKRPSRTAVVKLIKKFKRTGSVSNLKRTFRNREDQQSNDNKKIEKVANSSNNLIRITAQHLGISTNTLQRILLKDLTLEILNNADIYLNKRENKLMLFVMNRAARIIQRYWRNYRLRTINNTYLGINSNVQFRY